MLPSFLFRVGSAARVSEETNLLGAAVLNVSVLTPVSERFVVRFVRSCSPLGVLPDSRRAVVSHG